MKDVQKFNIRPAVRTSPSTAAYKANRTETHPTYPAQPYIRRALEAFRIPILYYEGFEADDVLGTLSHQTRALGHTSTSSRPTRT